jgi:predicted RNA polymerase sigma factor
MQHVSDILRRSCHEVRAKLLVRSGKVEDVVQTFQQAISLESDPAVRNFLQQRLVNLSIKNNK